MEISVCSFYSLSLTSCSCSTNSSRWKVGFVPQRRPNPIKIFASRRDHDYDGKLVDEDMIGLRKRIHEMKMVEEKHEPPSNWMEWEKRYYPNYDSDVCEAVGLLQSELMKMRPSMVLTMVVLVSISVPVSMGVIMFHLMELAKEACVGIPFC
ncbi:uncharacterized protein LOC107429368 [Ziziphus jujuba]|uniref:Uncharacterized protein LOC107429368 n=1 Tax=Ziziphus jujuba TaxID=326968 RepID=A0A6P4B161_ZIZJJ|nr:uncharacterized protein LOC107429368 [Ziziphus jujuba]